MEGTHMKKLPVFALLLCLAAGLFACGKKEAEGITTTAQSTAETTASMAEPTTLSADAMIATIQKAANSVKKLSNRLYYMEYAGDYGFSGFLERGGAASAEELAGYIAEVLSGGLANFDLSAIDFGCSTISAKLPGGGYGFGRNFDWNNCTAMIIKAVPIDGYASITTSNLDFLGFGAGYVPEGPINKMLSLASVYAPLDGMNEKGLCVAVLTINHPDETHQNTGKPNLTTTAAIRLLLDRAATVNEAIALLEQYDMHSDLGMMYHFAISDAEGRSVVVEYIKNIMYVTEAPVVTNFFLTPGEVYGIGHITSKQRFDILSRLHEETDGTMSMEQIKEGLRTVRHSLFVEGGKTTQWSIVYNQTSLELLFYHRENFMSPYTFQLTAN